MILYGRFIRSGKSEREGVGKFVLESSKLGEKLSSFQMLYFLKRINVVHQFANIFLHPAYSSCSISYLLPRRFLFVVVCFYSSMNAVGQGE